MLRLKRVTAFLLSSLLIFSFVSFNCFAENEEIGFSVSAFSDDASQVSWWENEFDGKYYVFMPSDVDMSKLTLNLTGANSIEVNGKEIENGETTDAFKAGGEYSVTLSGVEYQVVFLKSDNLPSIYIETESGTLDFIHESKKNKETADITVYESGEKTIDSKLEYIKGRGNSTWALDKKPYNIKFEKKIDLFGMGNAKKWCLIASAEEESLIRNKTVYDLAEDIGLKYSSKSQHVDLYINGDYMGNYLVCESVQIGSQRVNITDLEELNEAMNPGIDFENLNRSGSRTSESGYDAGSIKWVDLPNDPADISGGYLIEFEQANRYKSEVSGFVSKLGQPVTMKSPEYASKAQMEYISKFYQDFEDALCSADGRNSEGKHYSDYIDMVSMARMYLIQETAMNLDAGTTSFYLYKDANTDKLVASPVWDFDYSLGKEYKRYDLDFTDPEHWWASIDYIVDDRNHTVFNNAAIPTVLNLLCRHDDFMALVKKEWESNFAAQVGKKRLKKIEKLADKISDSAVMDAIRWNRYETSDVSVNNEKYHEQVKIVTDFLKKRVKFLETGFSEKAVKISYDANGGLGVVVDANGYVIGDSAKVQPSTLEYETVYYKFDSWNTEKDGSGQTYMPGDNIELDSNTVTLYAQWKKVPAIKAIAAELFSVVKKIACMIFDRFTIAVN
ncbi:MAG: CotH kinase family protein [Faecalibacterium sp.]|nr:CotH kinase family protein [Ruminococcus sp.]MCM1392493.1 CotH kinase family protein [Ruminococcus sp.]MCM1485184.1 CotH kinase family protein [Faecalibacterium sp.]